MVTLFVATIQFPSQGDAPHSNSSVSPSQLARDPRLSRKVTVEETGIALKDLARKLSDEKLTMVAQRDSAELKLQIRLIQRPLRDVMNSIATVLSGDWELSPEKNSYLFRQSYTMVSRRRRWWMLFNSEFNNSLAAYPTAALKVMRSPMSAVRHYSSNPDPLEAAKQIETGRMEDQAKYGFFSGLSGALQEQLVQQLREESFYSRGYRVDSGNSFEGLVAIAASELPQSARENITHYLAVTGDLEPRSIAFVGLQFGGTNLRSTFWDVSGKVIDRMLYHVDVPVRSLASYLDQPGLPKEVKRLGRRCPPIWKELAAYQTDVVWRNDPPDKMPDQNTVPPYRPGVLSWVARRANLEFVADYHSVPFRTWSTTDDQQPLSRPVKAELNFRAVEQDMSWKQADGIYLFRNNRWYRDDALEVPNSLLLRWATDIADLNRVRTKPTNDAPISVTYAKRILGLRGEIAATLTPWQIANGLKFAEVISKPAEPSGTASIPTKIQLPFGNVADLIMDNRKTLLFYNNLTDVQRTALFEDQLLFDQLSEPQKQQAVYLQGLIRIAIKMDQPIRLGLIPNRQEAHAYIDGDQQTYMWPNRTGIATVILNISAPRIFSN